MPWRLVLVSNVAAIPPAVTPKNFLRSIGAPRRANVAEFCGTDYGIGKTCRWQAKNGRKSFRESIFLALGTIAASPTDGGSRPPPGRDSELLLRRTHGARRHDAAHIHFAVVSRDLEEAGVGLAFLNVGQQDGRVLR